MLENTLDPAYQLEQEQQEAEPERVLIAQVLNRALMDACDQRPKGPMRRPSCHSAPSAERTSSAFEWIMSDDAEPMSCRWVCDVLGLKYDAVREQVQANPEHIHHILYQKHQPGRG